MNCVRIMGMSKSKSEEYEYAAVSCSKIRI